MPPDAPDGRPRSQKRRPDLNINTSYAVNARRDAVPATPPSKRPSIPSKAPPGAFPGSPGDTQDFEETFLDSSTTAMGDMMPLPPADPSLARSPDGHNKENEPRHNPQYQHLRGGAARDSHDLSLPSQPFTRDSLVTNMLTSLDAFSLSQINTPVRGLFDDDHNGFAATRADDLARSLSDAPQHRDPAGPRTAPPVAHCHTYSTEFETADEGLGPASSHPSHRRRSNSSSDFVAGLGIGPGFSSGDQQWSSSHHHHRPHDTYQPQRGYAGVQPARPMHSRGGTSMSSSANSIDAGYAAVIATQQRWAHGRKSPSMNSLGRNTPPPSSMAGHGQGHGSSFLVDDDLEYEYNSQRFAYDDLDWSAPQPTVPAGPRRPALTQAPSNAPPPPPPPGQAPAPAPAPASASVPTPGTIPAPPKTPDRKKNTMSRNGPRSRSSTTSKSVHGRTAPNDSGDVPPMPVMDGGIDTSAPAPLVGYRKSKQSHSRPPQSSTAVDGGTASPSATSTPTTATKDKPGFFRRVFGGGGGAAANSTQASGSGSISRNAPTSSSPSQRSHASPGVPSDPAGPFDTSAQTQSQIQAHAQASTQPQSQSQTQGSHHIAAQLKSQSQSAPPSRDSHHSSHPHVVQKKSSFFRRRKKSVAEPPLPPLPNPAHIQLNLNRDDGLDMSEPSPEGSLLQVMNPFLRESLPAATAPIPSSVYHDRKASGSGNGDDAANRTRGFSPDYDPSPGATIRTVKSQSALRSRESAGSFSRRPGYVDSPSRQPPAVPPKPSANGHDATFFSDSSDEGDKSRRKGRSPSLPQPAGSPASFAKRSPSGREVAGLGLRDASLSASPQQSYLEPSNGLPLQINASSAGDSATNNSSLQLPADARAPARSSMTSDRRLRSVVSLPSVKVDSSEVSPKVGSDPLDEPDVMVGEPTEDDCHKAQRLFDGDEDFILKEKAAAWMGEEGLVRQRVLKAYMDIYDFTNQSVLAALRQVCNRLVFRAETQQVDRILVAFSSRWCDCNPNHGFKTCDVIHTLCYSIMLLNTDLHLADIEQKMTRGQFVKNTMTTVKQAVVDTAPDTFERPSILPGKNPHLSPAAESEGRVSPDVEREKSSWRASFKPPPRSESAQGQNSDSGTPVDNCGPLVKAPFEGSLRAWEGQMELVLKDIYNSIRTERLPLFGAEPGQPQTPQGGLSVKGMLKRTPSVLSKAPSESQASIRGRLNDPYRNNPARWSSKSRSRPRLANGFSSSRTSFDDENSVWSPAASSATWSRYSLGRTQTSMSMDSFNSSYPQGDYQQSIGFANALSQAIIREDLPSSSQSILSEDLPQNTQMLDDETLELSGPPWVKEGLVIHKHHLDGVDRKSKDRNWTEVFAVIQKGTMSLFSFSTKSMRQKARMGRKQTGGGGIVVGGGNWQDNATNVGSFSLRQTLASALPPPGYSRTRSHVWALSLPTGAVHLFQVGTPEISKEFVLTVNYWSSRLSTHPLIGGISNVEYGWGDGVINNALISGVNEAPPPRPGSAAAGRSSMHSRQGSRQSSLRSSFDMGSNARSKLPGDKINIAEWTPPAQSMRPSNCSEAEQLETLLSYVKGIEDDLQKHNQLRSPMLLAFTPRGQNATKAMSNWERKSSYLLREIVKFRTYVDCLQHADQRRAEIYAERDNARRAARGEDLSDDESIAEDADLTITT